MISAKEKCKMKINIDIYEKYLAHRYGGWANEQGLFMKLTEELGEVAEVLNMRSGNKSANGEDLSAELAEELCDMIHYIIAIAAINGIDLSAAIIEKDKRGSAKYNHDINLEQFIKSRE